MASVRMRVCNKCGRPIDFGDKFPGFTYEGKAGYGSKYDGENVVLDLCCDCFDWLIDVCLISPVEEEDEDEEDVEF